MIVIHSQGVPIQCVWDRHKKLIAPHPYETIELDELASNMANLKAIMMDVNLNEASIYRIVNAQVELDGQAIPFEVDTDRAQLREQYQNMLQRLKQIQNAGVIPFTQAGFNQVVQAVKDEALYLERITRLIKSIVVG